MIADYHLIAYKRALKSAEHYSACYEDTTGYYESAAVLAMTIAIERFNPAAGVKFCSFAAHCVRQALVAAHRLRINRLKGFSHVHLPDDVDEIAPTHDPIPSGDGIDLQDAVDELPETQREIVALRYQGYSILECAETLHIPFSRARHQARHAREALAEYRR